MRRFAPTKVLEFNGTNEHFSLGTGFNFTDGAGNDSAFSVTGWFYMKSTASRGLISKRSVWEFALDPSNLLTVNLYTSGANYIGRKSATLASYVNQWVHLSFTYSGGETNASIKLYINGAQCDTTDSSAGAYTGMPSDSTTVTLGALDATLRWFSGYMGRVVVWNKELSLAEIKEDLTIEDLNFHSAKSSIRNWYDPESYDGTTLKDRKGGVDGTDTNMDSTNLLTGTSYPRRWQTRGDGETPFARFGGMSWALDGVNEYIEINDSSSLSFTSGGGNDLPFSFSVWAKPNSLTSFPLLCKGTTSNYEYFFKITSSSLDFYLATSGFTGAVGRLAPTTNITLNNMCHFVATYSGGKTASSCKIYLNGVQIDNTDYTYGSYTGMSDGTAPLQIGRFNNPSAFYGLGEISDTSIFDKELSSAEISQIYNNGQPRDETKTNLYSNLVGYWGPYNSSIGSNNVLDQSGNSLHGTMTNMETTDTRGGYRKYPVKIYDNTNKAAFAFGGTNEYASNSSLSVDNLAQFSFSIWFKTTSTSNYLIAFPEDGSGTNGCDLYFVSGALRGSVRTTTYDDINGGSVVTVNDGKWHLGTWTYDGANACIYVDGILSLYIPKTGTLSMASNQINIARFGSYGAYSTPTVTHVSVYNVGLSALEVEELYNLGTPADLTKFSRYSSAIHWYKFDNNDSATGTVTDHIGGKNLTCTNMEAGDKVTTDYPT